MSAQQNSFHSDQRTGLRVTSRCSGSAVIITVGGEIDASNKAVWNNVLSKIAPMASPPGPVTVDIRGVDFISGGAIGVLAREARRCRWRGVAMCVVTDQPIVARMVATGGLRPLLAIHPTVEAALSTTRGEPTGADEDAARGHSAPDQGWTTSDRR